MINQILETAGVILGISVTSALFALNIASLIFGRRFFLGHSACHIEI